MKNIEHCTAAGTAAALKKCRWNIPLLFVCNSVAEVVRQSFESERKKPARTTNLKEFLPCQDKTGNTTRRWNRERESDCNGEERRGILEI